MRVTTWRIRREALIWAGIMVVAVMVRIPRIMAYYPYMSYIDEGHVLHPVTHALATQSWRTANYSYPTLSIYAIAWAARISAPFLPPMWRPLHRTVSHSPPTYYDIVEPPQLLIIGRALTLAASVATVGLIGALGATVCGRPAGFAAAWWAALLWPLAWRSAHVMIDPFATMFVVAAVLAVERALGKPGPALGLAAAGVLLGCAVGSKYNAVVAVVAVAVRIIWHGGRDWGSAAAHLMTVAVGTAIGFAVSTPVWILDPAQAMGGIRAVQFDYSHFPALPLTPQLASEVGWPYLALVGAGCLLLLFRRATRVPMVSWCAYAAVLLAVHTAHHFRPLRNYLPLLALSCVPAGSLLLGAPTLAHRRWLRRSTYVLILLLPPMLFSSHARDWIPHGPLSDSRSQVADWLRAHASPSSRILCMEELAILPSELARIGGAVEVMRIERMMDSLSTARYDWVLADDRGWRVLTESMRAPQLHMTIVARFGEKPVPVVPLHWHGNRQQIFIVRVRNEAGP